MKYYLLTFNEDYADEHDVPALACFDEKQYEKWLKRPSGKANAKYKEQLAEYKEYQKGQEEFYKIVGSKTTTEKEQKAILEKYSQLKRIEYPEKSSSYLHASLGNSGDGFGESFLDCLVMSDFVKKKIVKVTEVTLDFYKTFNKAGLEDLSLCNIFSEDLMDRYDEEDEEE